MTSREKVYDFMEKAGILYLATEDGEKPKIRPLGFRMLVDGQIYFLTGKFKKLYDQMLRNSNVEFLAHADAEFMRYYGRVIMDEDEDNILLNKAFEKMPMLKEMYNDQTEYEPVIFHVDKAVAEIRDMHGIKEVYNFLD